MAEETRHILIGAVVLVLVAALFLFSAGRSGSAVGGYHILAKFQSVEGVAIDSAVRLAGVRIGRVSALDYDSDTRRAIVTMEIRPDIELPIDSIAIVTSEGILGSRFIRIDPGGALEPLREGGELEFTQDSILFEELLAKVIQTVERQRLAGVPSKMKPGASGTETGGSGQ